MIDYSIDDSLKEGMIEDLKSFIKKVDDLCSSYPLCYEVTNLDYSYDPDTNKMTRNYSDNRCIFYNEGNCIKNFILDVQEILEGKI